MCRLIYNTIRLIEVVRRRFFLFSTTRTLLVNRLFFCQFYIPSLYKYIIADTQYGCPRYTLIHRFEAAGGAPQIIMLTFNP